MNIIKFFFLSLVTLVIIAVVVVFVLVKTFNINAYLPQITKAASEALKREVSVTRAGLDVSFEGIAVDVFGVRVADPDPKAPSVQVDKIHARLELMPFVTRRTIEISGIVVSNLKVSATDPQMPLDIRIPNLNANVRDFSLTGPFPVTVDLTFASAGNNVHIQGKVRLDTPNTLVEISDLNVQTDLSELSINDIRDITPALAQAPLPGSVTGKATLQIPHLSAGAKAPADLKAEGELSITGVVLKDFNLLKSVLGRINVIPGLGEQIEGFLSDKLKAKLGGDDTVLDKVQVKFTVENQQVSINDALVQSSRVFEIKAKGAAAFDGTIGVDVFLYVAPDLSAALVKSVPPFQGLLDQDQRVYVPGKVSGQAPHVRYSPDMGYLGKKIITSEGVSQISGQLGKVLDKNPEVKEILNNVLNKIFK